MPRINVEDTRLVPVPVPPMKEQSAIVRALDAFRERCGNCETRVATAESAHRELAQSILAKAFRGELVPQDPTDEPASVLLERIRAERNAKEASANARRRRPTPESHA